MTKFGQKLLAAAAEGIEIAKNSKPKKPLKKFKKLSEVVISNKLVEQIIEAQVTSFLRASGQIQRNQSVTCNLPGETQTLRIVDKSEEEGLVFEIL